MSALVLDGVSAFSRVLSPFVSTCTPSCCPLLDGVSAFPRSCLPLSPFLFPFVGWCVRLPEALPPLSPSLSQLVSQLVFQLVSLLVSLCGGWSEFAFSPNSVLLGVLNVFLTCPRWCWMVCPPSRGLVSPLVSQLVSLLVFLCGGCTVRGS